MGMLGLVVHSYNLSTLMIDARGPKKSRIILSYIASSRLARDTKSISKEERKFLDSKCSSEVEITEHAQVPRFGAQEHPRKRQTSVCVM